jgi:HK97 family phage prohead protease
MPSIRLVGQQQFHAAARDGHARNVAVAMPSATVRRTADPSGLYPWTMSNNGVDRYKDSISSTGWKTENFMRAGGPVQFAHSTTDPGIGGVRWITSDAISLRGGIEPADHEFARAVWGLVDAGMMKGGSVGFIPLRWQYSDDPARKGGINFPEQELVEFSLTPVPALPSALLQARSIGIDTRPLARWAERALDCGNTILSRGALQRLREQAREPPRVTNLSARRRERDLARAREIEARYPRSREELLARAAQLRARYGCPEPVSDAERYAAEQEERRRDRAAAGDAVLRFGTQW